MIAPEARASRVIEEVVVTARKREECIQDMPVLVTSICRELREVTLSYIWVDYRYQASAYGRNVTDERERVTTRIPGLTTWGDWNQGENYGVEFQVSF